MSSRSSKYSNLSSEGEDLNDLTLRERHRAAQQAEAEGEQEMARLRVEAQRLMQTRAVSEEEYEYSDYSPVRRPLPRKTAFTAFFLLLVGFAFSIAGIVFFFTRGLKDERTIPFLVIGGIAFLPGSYASTIILMTWLGKPGYSYDALPSYDE